MLTFFSVIYLCARDDQTRHFMIRANILGMAEGDYLFIGARLTPPDEYAWRAYDEQDELAKKAYKYFMVVSNIFAYS